MGLQSFIVAALFSFVGATQLKGEAVNISFSMRLEVEQTSSSSSVLLNCENDDNFRLNGMKKKDCDWVAKKSKKRCKGKDKKTKKKIKNNCPLACKKKCKKNTPTSAPTTELFKLCYQDDPEFSFKGKPEKNCVWARKFQIVYNI